MITAIIQARMGSTRLPGKVLLPLGDKAVLEHVIGRTKKANTIDKIIVATSKTERDDAIETLCKKIHVACFRGNAGDVLDRYYQCAKKHSIAHIARITADCPLIDPDIIDRAGAIYVKGNYDYVSTAYPIPTFPDGLDVEIFSFTALEKTWQEALLPSQREHVTPYIWKHPALFRIKTINAFVSRGLEIKNEVDLSAYRFTLDEPRDYDFLKIIFERVRPLDTKHILAFLKKHPEVRNLNQKIKRNEGYEKSLIHDNDEINQHE